MSDTTVAVTDETQHHDGHQPASDADYVKVALGLAVLTAIEVALVYIDALKGMLLVALLLIVMAVKFVIVASRFMHLKYDQKLLSWVFYAGLILALAVYLVVLVTFRVFDTVECADPTTVAVPISCEADD